MAVLGCGRGHDAGFFGQKGFDVIGFDFVPQAIEAAKARYGQWASFEQADIFQLDPKYTHQFDYVLEYTCFCAIRPTQRQAYVQTVSSLLKTGGKLLGLFWIHPQTGGPPYSTSEKELLDLFSPAFEVAQLSLAQNSWGDRQGEEYLGLFIKR
jgi:SAM-dependent methyltransferase